MWKIIAILGVVQLADAAIVIIFGNSLAENIEARFNEPEKLLNSSYYNCSCPNLFYTHGFRGQRNGTATETSLKAMIGYKAKLCVNVFLLDWSEEASATDAFGEIVVKALYVTKVIPASYVVATELCTAMLDWSKRFCFNINNTQLIGHSLGAHLHGNCGRCIIEKGNNVIIKRILGLDPAGTLFDIQVLKPLDKTCASFVLIIHTDLRDYGINKTTGSVDVWVNYGNFIIGPTDQQVQPGCRTGTFQFMSKDALCSHDRAWQLFAEILNYYQTLQAGQAPDYYTWAAGAIKSIFILDYLFDPTASGNHYMITNATSPYGKGVEGSHP